VGPVDPGWRAVQPFRDLVVRATLVRNPLSATEE
jgi:hypothetical protein